MPACDIFLALSSIVISPTEPSERRFLVTISRDATRLASYLLDDQFLLPASTPATSAPWSFDDVVLDTSFALRASGTVLSGAVPCDISVHPPSGELLVLDAAGYVSVVRLVCGFLEMQRLCTVPPTPGGRVALVEGMVAVLGPGGLRVVDLASGDLLPTNTVGVDFGACRVRFFASKLTCSSSRASTSTCMRLACGAQPPSPCCARPPSQLAPAALHRRAQCPAMRLSPSRCAPPLS
jgi:hypothetical protein